MSIAGSEELELGMLIVFLFLGFLDWAGVLPILSVLARSLLACSVFSILEFFSGDGDESSSTICSSFTSSLDDSESFSCSI